MCAPQSKHDYSLYRAPATRAINERVSGNERVSARALSLPLPLSLSLSFCSARWGAHTWKVKRNSSKSHLKKKNELKICVFLCCDNFFPLKCHQVFLSFFLSFFFLSLFPFSANGTFNNNYYTRVHTHTYTHARRKKEKKKKKKKEEKIILIWWLVSSLRPLSTPCPSLDA